MKNYLYMVLVFVFFSCKKLVDIPPPENLLVSENVFSNSKTAAGVISNIYSQMSLDGSYSAGASSFSLICGLYSDELTDWSVGGNDQAQFYQNNLNDRNSIILAKWGELYKYIYVCNATIEGLQESNLNQAVKKQLIGEAKFVRAFQLFYLVNLWGDVPVPRTKSYLANANLRKSPRDSIYSLIKRDLLDARDMLSSQFLSSDLVTAYPERVRPTKWAASALLARVYLYTQDYLSAEAESSEIINKSDLFSLEAPSNTFLKDSKDAIWQIKAEGSSSGTFNSLEAYTYDITNGIDFLHSVSLAPAVVRLFGVEDLRLKSWIGVYEESPGNQYYYSLKYKNPAYYTAPTTEYTVVLRLAEQFLIRSEARLHLSRMNEAQEDVNMIRRRSGLNDTTINNKEMGLNVLLQERQRELFLEWGHRWMDIKRQPDLDSKMTNVTVGKGATWVDYKVVFPIPRTELESDKSLEQSRGY